MTKQKIYFVHEGKAIYPELPAYAQFLSDGYECEQISLKKLLGKEDLAEAICWMMMGHYPQKIKARLVIHDYRSLSVGKLHWVKDKIKKYTNAVPDLRIYPNKAIEAVMGFSDHVPHFYIPVGIADYAKDYVALSFEEKECDFCYIGVMSNERKISLILDSFLKRFGTTKTFHLYGVPEDSLEQRYKAHRNIVFKGKRPQKEVFESLKKARVAVNYFPNYFPHTLQTPTKLLEYGALGMRILSNDQPQSRLSCEQYGIQCLWAESKDMFQSVPDELSWPDNNGLDPTPMLWPSILTESDVIAQLQRALAQK